MAPVHDVPACVNFRMLLQAHRKIVLPIFLFGIAMSLFKGTDMRPAVAAEIMAGDRSGERFARWLNWWLT